MSELATTAWHQVPTTEALRLLGVELQSGLASEEVTRRQKEFGPNRVSVRTGKPAWLKFLQQFYQPLVYILLAAVGVTAFLGEWVDASVVFVNAIFGFLQESRAEKAIDGRTAVDQVVDASGWIMAQAASVRVARRKSSRPTLSPWPH